MDTAAISARLDRLHEAIKKHSDADDLDVINQLYVQLMDLGAEIAHDIEATGPTPQARDTAAELARLCEDYAAAMRRQFPKVN